MNIALVWQIMFYGWTVSELLIAILTRTRRGDGKRHDRGSMAILWIAIVGSITAAEFIAHGAGRNVSNNAHGLKVAAVVVLLAGLAIRWTAIASLGNAFSANVAIRDTQTLKRSGMYRYVRHPSYTGLLLMFMAVALHLHNWVAAALVLIPTAAALLYRIHVEEAALQQAFGAEYQAYSRVTRRLIPGIY